MDRSTGIKREEASKLWPFVCTLLISFFNRTVNSGELVRGVSGADERGGGQEGREGQEGDGRGGRAHDREGKRKEEKLGGSVNENFRSRSLRFLFAQFSVLSFFRSFCGGEKKKTSLSSLFSSLCRLRKGANHSP